ncbi:MAG: hypothetical protein LBT61_00375, partial [Prevotellaceae bacterium]|nr:hypothetical protein [Prevotellaceae bacterium]
MVFLCGLTLTVSAQEQEPALEAEPSSAALFSDKPLIVYDPVANNYLYYYSFDTRMVMPYKVISAEEYRREQFLNLLRSGWIDRNEAQASGGLKSGQLPTTFNIRSNVFRKVFGSNEITINPQGNVDLRFGINHTYT